MRWVVSRRAQTFCLSATDFGRIDHRWRDGRNLEEIGAPCGEWPLVATTFPAHEPRWHKRIASKSRRTVKISLAVSEVVAVVRYLSRAFSPNFIRIPKVFWSTEWATLIQDIIVTGKYVCQGCSSNSLIVDECQKMQVFYMTWNYWIRHQSILVWQDSSPCSRRTTLLNLGLLLNLPPKNGHLSHLLSE